MMRVTERMQRLLRVPFGAHARPADHVPKASDQKASRANGLVALQSLGEPVWSPRDYGAFAREGFMQNAIVYRCVRMVAEAAASIPLLLYRGTQEIESHPLLDLMRCPSYDHTGTDFLESWYGFLLVAGNAYVEAVAVGGEVRELHILRPDRIKVIPGPDGWPEGYEYSVNGYSVRFADEVLPGVRPILHTRLFHPANDHYGMSPIEAAATAIDIHNEASKWNKALLDNSARPSGALVYAAANGHMTAEQFERLKGELDASYQGALNAGRPMLLEGGLDWKPLSLSPKDMDFIAAKNNAAREIALALGVPPLLLGIPGDNTFSNDPYDPGGPTNRGITLEVFARQLGVSLDASSRARLIEELKRIPDETVRHIYYTRYWQPGHCAELPAPVALFHFDACVNHGVAGAARLLQRAAGSVADGEIGPKTLGAAGARPPLEVVAAYAALRRQRYRSLAHFWRFGRGWLARVDAGEEQAARLVTSTKTSPAEKSTALLPETPESKPPTKGALPMDPITYPDDTSGQPPAKWWGHSKTIWGALITAAATVAPALGPLIGIDLSGDVVRQAGEQTMGAIQAVMGLIGTLLTIYGRLKADSPISRKSVNLKL